MDATGAGSIPMLTTRASLLIRIRNREDNTAWSQFDAIYRPLLMRLCRARGLNEAQGEDIVQQCMVNVHNHIAGFEYDPEKGRFKSWLRTMAVRLIHNLARGARERPEEVERLAARADDGPSPEEVFDKLWMEEHLAFCLEAIRGELDAPTYEAFRLYVLMEKPADEVAKQLCLSSSELYRIKYRITKRLSEKMSELLDGVPDGSEGG
jgi:RNA polymerase sigma-70 factor (ECF subfamily)